MEWPRAGVYLSGQSLPTDAIPAFVKAAQFEQALDYIGKIGEDEDQDPMASAGTEALKSLDVGDIGLVFRDPANAEGIKAADDPSFSLAPAAYRILRAWIITDMVKIQPAVRNFPIYRG